MKRTADLTMSFFLLALLFPVMLLIGILIRIFYGPPVLFRQVRAGLYGKPFVIYKFRTMANIKYECRKKLADDKRIFPLGRFLRKTSLDELPELFNVLKGDMSLVGPRPLLMKYLKRYTSQQIRRHEVKPGLTGWAQVKGRNALTWKKKFEYDIWYVDNRDIWLDIKILLLTILQVIRGEGISHPGYATMKEFQGE